MSGTIRLTLLASAIGLTSGCGTLRNIQKTKDLWCRDGTAEMRVYGGVAMDVRRTRSNLREVFNPEPTEPDSNHILETPLRALVLLCDTCFLSADMPLSAVGDTVTLPITLASERRGPARKQLAAALSRITEVTFPCCRNCRLAPRQRNFAQGLFALCRTAHQTPARPSWPEVDRILRAASRHRLSWPLRSTGQF